MSYRETSDDIADEINNAIGGIRPTRMKARVIRPSRPHCLAEITVTTKEERWDEQQALMAKAPKHLRDHLTNAMLAEGVSLVLMNVRERGVLDHNTKARQRVWRWMRDHPLPHRGPPSYPEIAQACGLRSHSTIIESLQRAAKARAVA